MRRFPINRDVVRQADPDATTVYVLSLEGEFASEIHVNPIRRALKDAEQKVEILLKSAGGDETLGEFDAESS